MYGTVKACSWKQKNGCLVVYSTVQSGHVAEVKRMVRFGCVQYSTVGA